MDVGGLGVEADDGFVGLLALGCGEGGDDFEGVDLVEVGELARGDAGGDGDGFLFLINGDGSAFGGVGGEGQEVRRQRKRRVKRIMVLPYTEGLFVADADDDGFARARGGVEVVGGDVEFAVVEEWGGVGGAGGVDGGPSERSSVHSGLPSMRLTAWTIPLRSMM